MNVDSFKLEQLENLKLVLNMSNKSVLFLDGNEREECIEKLTMKDKEIVKKICLLIEEKVIINTDNVYVYLPILQRAWEYRRHGLYGDDELTEDSTFTYVACPIDNFIKSENRIYVSNMLSWSQDYHITKKIQNELLKHQSFWNNINEIEQLTSYIRNYTACCQERSEAFQNVRKKKSSKKGFSDIMYEHVAKVAMKAENELNQYIDLLINKYKRLETEEIRNATKEDVKKLIAQNRTLHN